MTTEECGGGNRVVNWWYNLQTNSLSSWNDNNHHHHTWNHPTNPNSSSSCEEDISVSTSFTNASNHSSLTVESSRRLVDPPAPSSNDFLTEHASDNHLWSHVLSGVGSNGEQEIGENFVDALSSKSMTSATMFEPACDYLKKLDTSNWDHYNTSSSFNNFEKQINGFSEAMMENNERLTKLSNLVSTWSIAPPDPEVSSSHFDHPPTTNNNNNNIPLNNNNNNNSSMDHHHHHHHHHYSQSDQPCHFKQYVANSCYDQDMKVKQEYEVFGKSSLHENGFSSMGGGESGKFYNGFPNLSSFTRNFSDVISFNNRVGRPVIGMHAQNKPCMNYLNLSEPKKQSLDTPPQTTRTSNGRGEGTTREVKKKRSEESSEATLKKAKQDTSTGSSSSSKVQAPKVKLGDKITALQQIVSPFGKTDTASVLFEAIGYIKFLQEQVQLLSNPYLKTNSHKDPWGSLDRKEKEEGKLDLRSRGLCLVPTSCTPLVYRENTGPDYWTPAYRGCLYR